MRSLDSNPFRGLGVEGPVLGFRVYGLRFGWSFGAQASRLDLGIGGSGLKVQGQGSYLLGT